MLTVTAVLESGNFLRLPESLCTQWGLEDDINVYVSMRDKEMCLTKAKQAWMVDTVRIIDAYCILPKHLTAILGIKCGSHVSLTLEDDMVTLNRSKIIPLRTQPTIAERLESKLWREFLDCKTTPAGERYQILLEDVLMFLILTEWDDTTAESLLEKPYPLKDLVMRFRGDEEYDDFFEKKIKELTLLYAAE